MPAEPLRRCLERGGHTVLPSVCSASCCALLLWKACDHVLLVTVTVPLMPHRFGSHLEKYWLVGKKILFQSSETTARRWDLPSASPPFSKIGRELISFYYKHELHKGEINHKQGTGVSVLGADGSWRHFLLGLLLFVCKPTSLPPSFLLSFFSPPSCPPFLLLPSLVPALFSPPLPSEGTCITHISVTLFSSLLSHSHHCVRHICPHQYILFY